MFCIVVGTGNTLHYGTNEDEESSLASSPTSSGPLSPKILTTSGNKTSSSQINKDDSHPPSAVREREIFSIIIINPN